MTRHARLLLALLAVPAVASCDRAPTTAREGRTTGSTEIRRTGTANASAVGAVKLSSGYTLSFVVSNNGSSVTTGTALFYSPTADVVGAINVTCLSVSGGHAKLSGTVVSSNDSGIVGNDAYFEVQDGSPDQANTVNLAESGTGPSCLDSPEYDLVNVSAGSLTVS